MDRSVITGDFSPFHRISLVLNIHPPQHSVTFLDGDAHEPVPSEVIVLEQQVAHVTRGWLKWPSAKDSMRQMPTTKEGM